MLKSKKLLSLLLAMLLVINISAVAVGAATAPGDPEALDATVELIAGRYDAGTKVFTPLAIGETVAANDIISVRIIPTSNYLVGASNYIVMFDKTLFTIQGANKNAFTANADNHYFSSACTGYSGGTNLPSVVWPNTFLATENYDVYKAVKVSTQVGTSSNPEVLPGTWLFQFSLKANANLVIGTNARIWTDARWFKSNANGTVEGYISKCLTGESSTVAKNTYDFSFNFDNADIKIPLTAPVAKSSIFFNTDGGSAVPYIRGEVGSTVTAPQPPTKTGYTFVRWDPVLPALYPAVDFNTTAIWSIKESTITFDANGGSPVASQTGDYGTTVVTPITPVREGYTFTGWQPAAPTTFPENNLTVTAQWTIKQITVTFDSAGGSAVTSKTGSFGTTLVAPFAPTKSGYAFNGWSPVLPSTYPANDLTVTAQWLKRIIITFDSDNGLTNLQITVNEGSALVPPADPTKTGYTFVGWSPSLPSVYPNVDTTYTAQWQIKQTTITFFTDDGTVIAPMTGAYGTPVIAPADPVKVGFNFNGWGPDLPGTFPADDLTVTAQWVAIVYYVNMTYNNEVVEGNSLEIPVPWLTMYSRVKIQIGYETNYDRPVRVEYLSSKPNVIVNQHGKVTNQGFMVRSSDITINIYDMDDNIIATNKVNILFYKTITGIIMEKFILLLQKIIPLFQK
ncbi:MAG: InlB B-repeat-containing protein [Clostridiales bacterium]|nr:InlB B-repeat-containing protein [Clostridiales bacterium]